MSKKWKNTEQQAITENVLLRYRDTVTARS